MKEATKQKPMRGVEILPLYQGGGINQYSRVNGIF